MTTDNSTDDRDLDDTLRPDVSALASAVISVLSDKSEDTAQSIRTSVVRKLVKATLRNGAFNAEMLLGELRDSRLSSDQIVDVYIPEAARELGTMWVDDAIGFAKVTIATARLQGLLTLLAPPWSAQVSLMDEGVSTLMILQANDTHTLGPHLAAAQLRRMGASVRFLFGPDIVTILQVLEEEHYDMVMFSSSRTDGLATIAQMIKRIRARFAAPPPIAVGGLVLNLTDKVKDKTDADLVSGDVKVAVKLCEKKRSKQKSAAR